MIELKTGFSEFSQTLAEFLARVEQWNDLSATSQGLVHESRLLSDAVLSLGDEAEKILQNPANRANEDMGIAWKLNYQWPEEARVFLLFMRNILFELCKGKALLQDKEVSLEQFEKLLSDSLIQLKAAIAEFRKNLDTDQELREKSFLRRVKRWRLQNTPWPAYRKQIEKIPAQAASLLTQADDFSQYGDSLRLVDAQVKEFVQTCSKEITAVSQSAEKISQSIGEECGQTSIKKLNVIRERIALTESQASLSNHLLQFSKFLDDTLEKLPEESLMIIGTRGGFMIQRELPLRKQVTQWMESEILPILYEVWELTESAFNGYKMSLVNIQSRISLMTSEGSEGKNRILKQEDLCQPLSNYSQQLDNSFASTLDLEKMVITRLEADFRLAYAFQHDRDFLDLPLGQEGSSRLNGNPLGLRIRKWWEQQGQRLRALIRSVEDEEALNTSEKIVRFINSRSTDPENSHYTSIFITKGFIGASFCVGRQRELRIVDQLVQNWRAGYRGSLCVTGQRFAGKSLFGEMIAHQHFNSDVIRLQPNEIIRWNGNRIQSEYDLGAVLDEIRKLSLNSKPMILIDDLELWWSPSIPVMQNAIALKNYLDAHATQFFFVVSMSNWLKKFLDTFQGFDRIFQSDINLDRMPQEEIREAILIRHGATHMKLRDSEGRKLTPQQIKKLSRKIFLVSKGNIGKALHLWAHSTHKLDDLRVYNDFRDKYSLPDFLNPDTALLLSFFRMQKRCNEYRLRKYFGPAFPERYLHVIKRMVSVGVLLRQMDGWLEINPLIIPEVDALLDNSEYQSYGTWKR